jgi:hypothetical protein
VVESSIVQVEGRKCDISAASLNNHCWL